MDAIQQNPEFHYGSDKRGAMNEFYQTTIKNAKPGAKSDARRARAHGQMGFYAMWRVAIEFPARAWGSNPELAKMAEAALARIDPSARAACLAEGLDYCVSGDKAGQAAWLLGLGAARAPWRGMDKPDGSLYAAEALGKHAWAQGAAGASWCALAAGKSAWRCLEAFEDMGLAAADRADFFKEGLVARVGSIRTAKEIFAQSHPWVVARGEMGWGDTEEEARWAKIAAAWEPTDVDDKAIALKALGWRARFRQNPKAADYLSERGCSLGSPDHIVDAMLTVYESSGSSPEWFEALARWSAAVEPSALPMAEAAVARRLFQMIEEGDPSAAEEAAQALTLSLAMRASGKHGWGAMPPGEGSALAAKIAIAISGSDGEVFESRSSARAAIDELISTLESQDGMGGPKRSKSRRV